MQAKIKLLIVDDSKLVRKTIAGIFQEDDSIDVVGEAVNAEEALRLIPELRPDVITLDINMPGMDGLSALKHVMIKYRIPTLMLSSATQEGSTPAFDSLKYGAVDFIPKININTEAEKKAFHARVIEKVRRGLQAFILTQCVTRSLAKRTKRSAPMSSPCHACWRIYGRIRQHSENRA